MFVIKRSGKSEPMKYDNITERNKKLAKDLSVDVAKLSQMVIQGLKSGMSTEEIDHLSAETAASMSCYEPEFDTLAARIAVSNLHKTTNEHFVKTMKRLHDYSSPEGRKYGLISDEMMRFMTKNREELETAIDYKKDFNYTYFGLKTLEKSYLHRIDGKVVERPQHMLMRVAVELWGPYTSIDSKTNKKIKHDGNMERIIETYNLLSDGYYTNATPTLYNSCSSRPQLSSCFLLTMDDDLEHIYKTNLRCALISKWSGGIAVDINKIRAKGSKIFSTNGESSGIVPMIQVFNATARYCDQGGGKRKGSIAMYLSPFHPDIFDFLQLRFNMPPMEIRALDTFLALWIPDIFMRRVENNEMWSLICPSREPRLTETYAEEFEQIYLEAEAKGLYTRQVKARDVWEAILKSQIETGQPYLHFSDSVNRKNMQKNIGIIRSSNLCVSGDTKILTKDYGWKDIKELEDTSLEIWNGYEWSNSLVKKTNESSKLIRIEFSDGTEIKCTKYHQFIVPKGARNDKIQKVEARELEVGSKLAKIPNLPVIEFEKSDFKYSYTSGFYTGDGTNTYNNKNTERCVNKKKEGLFCGRHIGVYGDNYSQQFDDDICECVYDRIPMIRLYGEKKKLVDVLDTIGNINYENEIITVRLPRDIKPKYTIPFDEPIKVRLDWLAGLIDSDGCNASNCIQIGSIHKDFLLNVKLMCQTLGVNPLINKCRDETQRLMPDHKGGEKLYDCKAIYRLCFNKIDTLKLLELGINTHRVIFDKTEKPNRDARHFTTVIAITELSEPEPTWCFGEPLRNQGMFNGILTGNCSEILLHTKPDSIAVCNLASLSLPKYVKYDSNGIAYYDYHELGNVTERVVDILNNVIDRNYYPVKEAEQNNKDYRPIGIGVTGLADVFAMLNLAWDNPEAKKVNKLIFETMYYHAVKRSNQLALEYGSYVGFEGSPYSQGILEPDLWSQSGSKVEYYTKDILDWNQLREDVKRGMRNSVLMSLMPSASTSQIMGNTESFECITSNIYSRSTLSGDFVVVNKHLYRKLRELGLWNKNIVDKIIAGNGSIQNVKEIPEEVKRVYKTTWEHSQRTMIDLAGDRSPFIDQSQSLNIFMANPTVAKLTSMHFYSWKLGMKLSNYYIRSKPANNAIKFTIDKDVMKEATMITSSSMTNTSATISSSDNKAGKEYIKDGKKMVCYDDVCTSCGV